MGNKKVYSKPGPNGKTLHFDGNGKYVGSSFKSFNGNVKHLDAKGKYAGTSFKAPSGAVKHFDAKGKYSGSSIDGAIGGQIHFDASGKLKGRSTEAFGNRYASVFHDSDEKNTNTTIPTIIMEKPTQKQENIYISKGTASAILGLLFILIIIGLIFFL